VARDPLVFWLFLGESAIPAGVVNQGGAFGGLGVNYFAYEDVAVAGSDALVESTFQGAQGAKSARPACSVHKSVHKNDEQSQFVDSGENFERVVCPKCRADLTNSWRFAMRAAASRAR
jgi:hypothetical protein